MSRRTDEIAAAAEALYSRAMDVAEFGELRIDDDLDKLADALRRELRPRWVRHGSSRTVIPIGRKLVLKFGQEDEMLDEWNRWVHARQSPRSRRWMLPIVVASPGRWAVMPLASALSPASIRAFDRLQRQAELLPIFCGIEDDLGLENWGTYKGRPVVIDYGGGGGRNLQVGHRNEDDPFDGYSIRVAVAGDPRGGTLGTGRWVLERDGVVIHRFTTESTAFQFLQQIVHKGGRRPWRGSGNQLPCKIVYVGEDSEHEDIGFEAEDVFRRGGIRLSSHELGLFACLDGDRILGMVAGGWTPVDDERAEFRFSVVTREGYRRQGIARSLVRATIDHYQKERSDFEEAWGSSELAAWVINPYMADLLESEGFEADWGGWSQDNPFMRWTG